MEQCDLHPRGVTEGFGHVFYRAPGPFRAVQGDYYLVGHDCLLLHKINSIVIIRRRGCQPKSRAESRYGGEKPHPNFRE